MPIPTRLDEWNLDAVRELVASNVAEPDTWEFKAVLDSQAPEYADGLRKTVCSLANTRGGFVIVGVSEHGMGAQRIVGIPSDRENPRKFVQKMSAIEPAVLTSYRQFPIDGTLEVMVVEVQATQIGPHSCREARDRPFQFWRRAHRPAILMSYSEIAASFVNQSEHRAVCMLVHTALADAWTRFVEIRQLSAPGRLSLLEPDAIQLRQHLGEVQSQCREAVSHVFAILRASDVVTVRLQTILALHNSALMGANNQILEYSRALVSAIAASRESFERTMTLIQDRFQFPSMETPIGPIPPIPTTLV